MQFKKSAPKGARLSPQSQAILAHLKEHGRRTFEQLHEVFKESARFRSNGPAGHTPNPEWLRSRLGYMRDAGIVWRECDEGTVYYKAGQPSQSIDQEPAPPAAEQACVTPPRRTYVMQGDPYQPPPPTPCRDGAMDFANCPSIEAGRARPFIPGKVIHG
ncbi:MULTISPECIES: hypothetical protein [unclassified Polaromonas]|jgi:hypothetical protein|uniref:hypothetical protein n=1 Tax=unclassified Polaromonas TaxID=2638319 RepID=UPI0025E40F9B|nr:MULTISPECIES: hypothetical protein [unclassified Polaromonas]HQR98355.1 hypothetical protein [Polaromonas sp.]HQS39210.1 hypothetical protein [Polaromonas sp.]HQS86498.1 hypothetical protein [Polaromonas sp.]HQT06870.1 hypothetical protein [Polaromonas sp.]